MHRSRGSRGCPVLGPRRGTAATSSAWPQPSPCVNFLSLSLKEIVNSLGMEVCGCGSAVPLVILQRKCQETSLPCPLSPTELPGWCWVPCELQKAFHVHSVLFSTSLIYLYFSPGNKLYSGSAPISFLTWAVVLPWLNFTAIIASL